MTNFKVQTRPDGAASNTRPRSRHRATPARPGSARSRFAAHIGYTGRRAAVVATACAVLIGVGAAGQAAELPDRPATAGNATGSDITADPLPRLDFERVRVDAPAVAPAPDVAPASAPAPASVEESVEAKPAEAPAPVAAPPAAPAPAAPAPEVAQPVAVDDPEGAQAYAAAQLGSYGWAPNEMQCLAKLWTKESDWKTTATNPSSGAYGVVQSLPAEKMASAGADYRTNYKTQINWGLTYVQDRYGSPCGALNFHYAHNWY